MLRTLISIVVPDPVHEGAVAAARWLLPILLAAERRLVQVDVGAHEQIRAAAIGGVGVVDIAPLPQEHAEAVLLAIVIIGFTFVHHVGLAPVVVFDWSDGLVKGHMEIVIEVAAKR